MADTTTLYEEDIIESEVVPSIAARAAGGTSFSWSAAIAGVFAAIAVSLLVVALGSGIGLSFASPYTGPSATTLTVAAAVWLVMAQAMGIPVPWVHTATFAIGAGMAAASGVLFGPLVGVNHTMGLDWVLKAFIVVVVGGMGNLGGSIAAAIFISLLEAYATIWVDPSQAVIVSFVVLILTLLFRPTGLFVPTPK